MTYLVPETPGPGPRPRIPAGPGTCDLHRRHSDADDLTRPPATAREGPTPSRETPHFSGRTIPALQPLPRLHPPLCWPLRGRLRGDPEPRPCPGSLPSPPGQCRPRPRPPPPVRETSLHLADGARDVTARLGRCRRRARPTENCVTVATRPGGGPDASPARGEPDRGAVVDGVMRAPPRTARGTARNAEPPARETPGDPPIVADHAVPRLRRRPPPPVPPHSRSTPVSPPPSLRKVEPSPSPSRPDRFLRLPPSLGPTCSGGAGRHRWTDLSGRASRRQSNAREREVARSRGHGGGPRRTGRPPADGPCTPRGEMALVPPAEGKASHRFSDLHVTLLCSSVRPWSQPPGGEVKAQSRGWGMGGGKWPIEKSKVGPRLTRTARAPVLQPH